MLPGGGPQPAAQCLTARRRRLVTALVRAANGAAVTGEAMILGGVLVAAALLDMLVRPRPLPARSIAGLWLGGWLVAAAFGLFLALSGHAGLAAGLTLAVVAFLALASNAKRAMLGEPLVFADLALIGAIFRHPQFYISAVRPWQQAVVVAAAAVLALLFAILFVWAPAPHLAGLTLLATGLVALDLTLRLAPAPRLAPAANGEADTLRHGLLATLLLHWWRWRAMPDPAPRRPLTATAPGAPELVVIIQCESFADPAVLLDDPTLALPALSAAQRQAWQWGRLQVSGFGAYTMRAEYGVLFGREEEALGLRRFNPYLTAVREGSWALPARLAPAGWRSVFFHPHDLRFYNRDRIMPAAGFAQLVGPDGFAPPAAGQGRYVTDANMADTILDLAGKAEGPTLLHAVTIENHGPWSGAGARAPAELVAGYLRLLRHGDAMLARLQDGLARLGRPALLVFYGDHRPSIPGATAPGGDRDTPYVMLRFDATGAPVSRPDGPVDLTPAALHHAVLDVLIGASADQGA